MSGMDGLNRINKESRKIDNEKKKDIQREKLKERLSRNVLTSFVFAISEFEKEFGEFWGKNLSENNLSPEQKLNRDKWIKIRKNVFDKGNAQRRYLEKEIDAHSIEHNGYKIKIIGKEENGNS